jgi:predicted MFS family arabinose efflux permease
MLSQVTDFTWFSTFAILRLGIANLASPLNSSLYMRLISPEEKATASSITHTTSRLSIALATWLGGRIMVTSLDLPIYLGAGLYVIYAAAYFLLLRDEESRRQGVATAVYEAPGLIPVRSDPKR